MKRWGGEVSVYRLSTLSSGVSGVGVGRGSLAPLGSRSLLLRSAAALRFRVCCASALLLLLLSVALLSGTVEPPLRAPSARDPLPPYAVFLDAGSTGTRVHVFSVTPGRHPPAFTLAPASSKLSSDIPLASLVNSTQPHLWAALQPLMQHASTAVPASLRARTPLHVWATAGMRVLPEPQQQALYSDTFAAVSQHTDFAVNREVGFRTISGEEEGFFGWLAANTLAGTDFTALRPGSPMPSTMGALDVGGGSAQVVFAGGGGESALRGPRRAGPALGEQVLSSLRASTYTKSYLGFGAVAMEARVKAALVAAGGITSIKNPCAFADFTETLDGVSSIGTGDFDQCAVLVANALRDMQRTSGSVVLPKSATTQGRFMGMSLLFHVTHFLAVAAPKNAVSRPFPFPQPRVRDIANAGRTLCATPWHDVQHNLHGVDPHTPPPRLQGRCLDCALVATLLGASDVGYGFAEESARIVFVDKVQDTEVEWSLGAAVATLHPRALQLAFARDAAARRAASLAVVAAAICALVAGKGAGAAPAVAPPPTAAASKGDE